MSPTDPGTRQTILERVARRTHGVVTPANVVDLFAMWGVGWSAPRLDRWSGIAVAAPSYLADIADGAIARRTNTTSRVGELVDHVGDKPKVFWGLWQIWRLGLADKALLAAVAGYNVANAALTGYDVVVNEEPQISVSRRGKRAMFTGVAGVGAQVIGHKLAETCPRAGRLLTVIGAVFGYGGLVRFGIPTTRDYWDAARGGKRRARFARGR